MKLDLKKMLRLECIGIVLILALFFILDYYPKLKRAGKLKGEIRLAKTNINTVSQSEREEKKKELEEELGRGKEEIELIKQAILDIQAKVMQEKNIPLVTQEIVEIASSAEIDLTSVKPLTAQVKDGYELIPVEMRFQCGYTDLINFLSKIEASSALVNIENLSMNKDETISPELDICLTANALFVSIKEASDSSLED